MIDKEPAKGSPYIQILPYWRSMDLGKKKKRYKTRRMERTSHQVSGARLNMVLPADQLDHGPWSPVPVAVWGG